MSSSKTTPRPSRSGSPDLYDKPRTVSGRSDKSRLGRLNRKHEKSILEDWYFNLLGYQLNTDSEKLRQLNLNTPAEYSPESTLDHTRKEDHDGVNMWRRHMTPIQLLQANHNDVSSEPQFRHGSCVVFRIDSGHVSVGGYITKLCLNYQATQKFYSKPEDKPGKPGGLQVCGCLTTTIKHLKVEDLNLLMEHKMINAGINGTYIHYPPKNFAGLESVLPNQPVLARFCRIESISSSRSAKVGSLRVNHRSELEGINLEFITLRPLPGHLYVDKTDQPPTIDSLIESIESYRHVAAQNDLSLQGQYVILFEGLKFQRR